MKLQRKHAKQVHSAKTNTSEKLAYFYVNNLSIED